LAYLLALDFLDAHRRRAPGSFPHKAGAASSLLGAMHYGSGILSAAMVGWFSDGTPWTMAWIMAAAGIGSLATSVIFHAHS